MQAVLLHGLVPAGTVPALGAPDHVLMPFTGFSALTSAAPPDVKSLGADAMAELALKHHAVLVAYCASGEVLPMRFGAAFSSAAAVHRHLVQRSEPNLRAFQALAGMREYLVRLTVTCDPPLPPRKIVSGRDFLARGRETRDRRNTLAETRSAVVRRLLSALQEINGDIEAAGASKPGRLLDVAVLLPIGRVPELTLHAQSIEAEAKSAGMDLHVSGPWPAYSFRLPEPEECHGA